MLFLSALPPIDSLVSLRSLCQYGTLITHGELESDLAQTLGGDGPPRVSIPLSDYILGITDLGGELMRFATNTLTASSAGSSNSVSDVRRNQAVVVDICNFLRDVYAAFQPLSAACGQCGPYRELPKKLDVWLASLQKLETLCYKIQIRTADQPNQLQAVRFNMATMWNSDKTTNEREEGAGGTAAEE